MTLPRADGEPIVDAAVLAGGLAARYAQPHRRYHTLEHVHAVLRHIDELSPPTPDRPALQLAAWFHDATYAPGRDDNETRSAFLAQETLEVIGASPDLRTEVKRLVELTRQHQPEPCDVAGAVLCDADLAILAAPRATYDAYAIAVRQEYEVVPDEVFRPARAQILRRLLDRAALFHTSAGHDRWETPARQNIERELDQLDRPVPTDEHRPMRE